MSPKAGPGAAGDRVCGGARSAQRRQGRLCSRSPKARQAEMRTSVRRAGPGSPDKYDRKLRRGPSPAQMPPPPMGSQRIGQRGNSNGRPDRSGAERGFGMTGLGKHAYGLNACTPGAPNMSGKPVMKCPLTQGTPCWEPSAALLSPSRRTGRARSSSRSEAAVRRSPLGQTSRSRGTAESWSSTAYRRAPSSSRLC